MMPNDGIVLIADKKQLETRRKTTKAANIGWFTVYRVVEHYRI